MTAGVKPEARQFSLKRSVSSGEIDFDTQRELLPVNSANAFAPIADASSGALDTPPLTLTCAPTYFI